MLYYYFGGWKMSEITTKKGLWYHLTAIHSSSFLTMIENQIVKCLDVCQGIWSGNSFLNRKKILQKYPSSLLPSLPGELIFNTPLLFPNQPGTVLDSKLEIIKSLPEFRQHALLEEPSSSATAVVSWENLFADGMVGENPRYFSFS